MKTLVALIFTTIILMGACTPQPRPTPRRVAYPRVDALPDSFVTIAVGGNAVDINAQAVTALPKDGWLDVSYPGYGATLHLTTTAYKSTDELQNILSNRLERMTLNLGDVPGRELKFTNEYGFECRLLAAQTGTTPLQILAVGPQTVVSGAVIFHGSTTPVDSVAPIIQELDNQLVTILKNLRRAN